MGEIATERLTLRPSTASDAELVHKQLAQDFDVVRHTGSWPWPADLSFTKLMCSDGYSVDGGWMMAFVDGALAGMIGLGPNGDFGYMLPRHAWRRGYATEMSRAFLTQVAADKPHDQIRACVFTDNPASARVLEKLGFTEGPACSGRCEARDGDFPTRTFTLELKR